MPDDYLGSELARTNERVNSLIRVDGILDKRIRYIERRVWLLFGLVFVLIFTLFVALAAVILSL